MGLKFNTDKYLINNAGTRIKATTVNRSAPQYDVDVRKKVNDIKKNKKLSIVNRKFLRLIASK